MAKDTQELTSEDVAILGGDAVTLALTEGADMPEPEDAEDISRSIALRILTAQTADGVFDTGGATPAQELLGVPIMVKAVRWNRSGLDGGPKVFAVIEGDNLQDGTAVIVTCSGRNVMAQLHRLNQLGSFPLAVKIVKAERPTAAGYTPLWLARA